MKTTLDTDPERTDSTVVQDQTVEDVLPGTMTVDYAIEEVVDRRELRQPSRDSLVGRIVEGLGKSGILNAKTLVVFAFVWLMAGFFSGTATLIGPVRLITNYGRSHGWSSDLESWVVRGAIGVYVVASALIAIWLSRIVLRSTTRHVRFGIPVLALLAAAGALWLWFTPEVMGGNAAVETDPGSSFSFGPYATEERMRELKQEGFDVIVSLLHPAVVPFETKLVADGKTAAERVGIQFLHIPMLPWVSENTEALERIRELAQEDDGKRYYVHCYLGKDRVRLFRNMVRQVEPSAALEPSAHLATVEAERSLSERIAFERGEVILATEDVYLIPYPTDSEFMKYILPGAHGPVVSLLDPANPEDLQWIEKERDLLASHLVGFESHPVSTRPFDPQAVLDLATTVALMERPVVVHSYLAVSSGRSPSAEAFLQAFRSHLPPLPPSLFRPPMSETDQPVTVVAPNVAVGPRPAGRDFGAYLRPRGVREIVYLGHPGSPEAVEAKSACATTGLGFSVVNPKSDDLVEKLSTGGPWYVFGPGLESVREKIVTRLGPAIPDSMRWDPVLPSDPLAGETQESARGFIGFIRQALPSPKSIVLLSPLFLVFAASAALYVGWLRSVKQVRVSFTRKIFHFIIFTSAGLLHLAGGLPQVILFGGTVSLVVLYAVYRGDGFEFYEAMARPTDAPRRSLFILIPLLTTALGGLLCNILFPTVAYIGYLVAGWGDAIGEPVGAAWGRHRYKVPSLAGVAATRSIEGSIAVCLVGALAAFVGLSLGGIPPLNALGIAVACGIAGATVEAVSNHGLDNLTIQVAAAGTAFLLLV